MNVNVSEKDARRIISVLFQLLEKYDIENSNFDYKSFAFVDKLITFDLEDIPIFKKFIKKVFRSDCSVNNKNVGKFTF